LAGRLKTFPYIGFMMTLFMIGAGCSRQSSTSESAGGTQVASATTMTPVKRGEYLVKAMGCNDCHTPWKLGANGPEPDMTKYLSGHPADVTMPPPPDLGGQAWQWTGAATMTAFAGPWGVTYSANLTPDVTGLGPWTADQFIQVMRSGKIYGGSRPIMPPMPWQDFATLSDDDLKAVFTYLQSIPAISNHVPDYQPPAGPGAR